LILRIYLVAGAVAKVGNAAGVFQVGDDYVYWNGPPLVHNRIILAGRRLTMEISTLGIDLSKTTFHVIGLNAQGKIVLRKKFSRKQLLVFTANRQQMLIGMEACGGAHYLARALREQGHDVRLMPAQYVKPYVKTNKNDYLDAEAIAEAVQRPTMRFVPIKTDEQLDLQALHRVRDRWVARRTAVMNQMRGFLLERGITMRKGPSHLAAQLQIIFGEGNCSFSGRTQGLLLELKHEWDELERRIEEASAELQRLAKQDDACSRLMEIPGIGPLVSTALVASVGNAITFRKGRDLAAWLGLVPRQHSTGGRPKLLGISKRGNEYLRRMLLHGARSVMMQVERNSSALGVWITNLSKRKHHNVTAVALANKMARIAWAMLTRGSHYSASQLAVA
jgi:transposase